MSVRPESITIEAADADAGGAFALQAIVDQVAYLGSAVQYQIRTEGGLALSVLAGKTGPRFESGQRVQVGWLPPDALVIGDRSAELEDDA